MATWYREEWWLIAEETRHCLKKEGGGGGRGVLSEWVQILKVCISPTGCFFHISATIRLQRYNTIHVQWIFCRDRHHQLWRFIFTQTHLYHISCLYSGPCNLRPLELRIPTILRPVISGTILFLSIQISFNFYLQFKTKFSGWKGGFKMQSPLYTLMVNTSITLHLYWKVSGTTCLTLCITYSKNTLPNTRVYNLLAVQKQGSSTWR